MNRRTALLLTTLLSGLAPGSLLAQQTRGTAGRDRRAPSGPSRSARRIASADDEVPEPIGDAPESSDEEGPPGDFPDEPGRKWSTFDIAHYTGLRHTQNNPQNAIIEWIFRRTQSAPWHADKIAVLCASRTQLRAYHTPKMLEQVKDMVERFTDATADVLTIRVRFVAAADSRWRYAVYSRLNPLGSGPQGQQIWTLAVQDAAMVLAQMQVYQGFKLLSNNKYDMINGQTLTVETTAPHSYVGGLQRENTSGVGYQPGVQQLQEGVTLRLSPLLSFEGDTLDAAIELKANTVKSLHRTKVIAPREIGPAEMTIDVPEANETRLNQTIKGWPVGQTLLISAGIHPGILQSKAGFMNLRIPGTVPTSTELLVFIEVEPGAAPARADRGRVRE